jgi:hypothetical protein
MLGTSKHFYRKHTCLGQVKISTGSTYAWDRLTFRTGEQPMLQRSKLYVAEKVKMTGRIDFFNLRGRNEPCTPILACTTCNSEPIAVEFETA